MYGIKCWSRLVQSLHHKNKLFYESIIFAVEPSVANLQIMSDTSIFNVIIYNEGWTKNAKIVQSHIFYYCRTGFHSNSLTAAKIARRNDRYRWNSLQKLYFIWELSSHLWDRYRQIAIIFISWWFEGNANISVAIKYGSTVCVTSEGDWPLTEGKFAGTWCIGSSLTHPVRNWQLEALGSVRQYQSHSQLTASSSISLELPDRNSPLSLEHHISYHLSYKRKLDSLGLTKITNLYSPAYLPQNGTILQHKWMQKG